MTLGNELERIGKEMGTAHWQYQELVTFSKRVDCPRLFSNAHRFAWGNE
jgi:hypothetical protein